MDKKYALVHRLVPDWVLKLYQFFTNIPATVAPENYWFYNISNLAYVLIAVLHTLWIFVFVYMGVTPLVNIQFFSVSSYILALFLNRKGYHMAGMIICLVEANVHQAIAVTCLGWSAGFQNFIPLVALLPFLKYNESWVKRIVLGCGCLLCYLYIDRFIKGNPPLFGLSAMGMGFFNVSNALLCFFLAALWGIVLAISYQRTVTELLRKEQELFESQKAMEQAEILRQLDITERDNEIYHLRNIELKNSNDEVVLQKKRVEDLVAEQEQIILQRTRELADANIKLLNANRKLIELIQYNSHYLREPLTRIMGAMSIYEDMDPEEFHLMIWPQIERSVTDLDRNIKDVIKVANESIKLYS